MMINLIHVLHGPRDEAAIAAASSAQITSMNQHRANVAGGDDHGGDGSFGYHDVDEDQQCSEEAGEIWPEEKRDGSGPKTDGVLEQLLNISAFNALRDATGNAEGAINAHSKATDIRYLSIMRFISGIRFTGYVLSGLTRNFLKLFKTFRNMFFTIQAVALSKFMQFMSQCFENAQGSGAAQSTDEAAGKSAEELAGKPHLGDDERSLSEYGKQLRDEDMLSLMRRGVALGDHDGARRIEDMEHVSAARIGHLSPPRTDGQHHGGWKTSDELENEWEAMNPLTPRRRDRVLRAQAMGYRLPVGTH